MYLDPGAWSIIVQVLVGALVSIPVLLGLYWHKIKTRLARRKVKVEEDN